MRQVLALEAGPRPAGPPRGDPGQPARPHRRGRTRRLARIPRHRRPFLPRPGRTTMTTLDPRRLDDALRAGARGIHPLEAGTGLLIECGSWLHRTDFAS